MFIANGTKGKSEQYRAKAPTFLRATNKMTYQPEA
jgi:hypothetical protein